MSLLGCLASFSIDIYSSNGFCCIPNIPGVKIMVILTGMGAVSVENIFKQELVLLITQVLLDARRTH